MTSSDIRAKAREALAGQWPMAVLVGFVAALLGGAGNSVSGFNIKLEDKVDQLYDLAPELAAVLMGAIGALGVLAFVYALVMVVLGSVINQGYRLYNLKLVDGRMATMGDLFSRFGRFWDAFLLSLLMGLFTFLWALLLIVPGIVASYRYAMAPYILLEDPDCTPLEAIERSKTMMDGNKWDLFCLDLSFIGWEILCAFTFGLGGHILRPYINAAHAVFYRQLQYGRPRTDNPYGE